MKSEWVRSKLRSQPQKVCSDQNILINRAGNDLIPQDRRMNSQVNSSLSKGELHLLCPARAVEMTYPWMSNSAFSSFLGSKE